MTWWTVQPEWPGETVFIIGGGPSVAQQNLGLLNGRRVIVINSSYLTYPSADFLIAHDPKWWRAHGSRPEFMRFAGRVVQPCENPNSRWLHLRKARPPGLSLDRQCVSMRRTTLTAAINLAAHLGVRRMVLLGADGRKDDNGRSHHHDPHPWSVDRADRWRIHAEELASIVPSLQQANIEVVNASPGSTYEIWPIMRLEDVG